MLWVLARAQPYINVCASTLAGRPASAETIGGQSSDCLLAKL
jgi:hypothetical protein